MIVRTNVKINLGLEVIRKRTDGYHDIETLFVPCHEFGDTIEIIAGDDYSRTSAALFAKYQEPGTLEQAVSPAGGLMITIARAEGIDWNPLNDLCAKAWSIIAADHKLPPIRIFLEKTAPVGAGLGGGSADAAFTLKAINEICGLQLSERQLFDYAARLGSDCAFFIANRPMIGTGRGEILEPYDIDLSAYEIKVLVPENVTVSTAEAYKGIVPREAWPVKKDTNPSDEAKNSGGEKDGKEADGDATASTKNSCLESLKSILAKPIEQWKGLLVNDFETTVFKKHPELAAIKQSLYDSGAVYASMSGSGSAIFGIYKK